MAIQLFLLTSLATSLKRQYDICHVLWNLWGHYCVLNNWHVAPENTFRYTLVNFTKGVVRPPSNAEFKNHPLIGCPRLLIHYTRITLLPQPGRRPSCCDETGTQWGWTAYSTSRQDTKSTALLHTFPAIIITLLLFSFCGKAVTWIQIPYTLNLSDVNSKFRILAIF
jgi:hypothetical protein